jgi:hypothetical protein
MTKYVIIQNTWSGDDDKDLLDYVKIKNMKVKFLSKEEILQLSVEEIEVLFADTTIMQQIIKKKFTNCYPTQFNELYLRNIEIMKVKDLKNLNKKCFVKPYNNDKSFESHIIRSENDVKFLLDDIKKNNILEDENVFVCQLVNFVNEYRLFIANNKVCGIVNSTDVLIHKDKAKHFDPPSDFIDKILSINPYPFCVIDVGSIDKKTEYQWTIVEVNPPFALTSYDWNIENYFNYCKDAWNYFINEK